MDEKEEEGKPIIAVYWSAPEAIGKRWEHIYGKIINYGAVQCLCNCRYISLLFIIIIITSKYRRNGVIEVTVRFQHNDFRAKNSCIGSHLILIANLFIHYLSSLLGSDKQEFC